MPESDLKTTVSPGWQPDAEGEVGLAAGSVRREFQLWEWGVKPATMTRAPRLRANG